MTQNKKTMKKRLNNIFFIPFLFVYLQCIYKTKMK